jgi:hypothetical protein
MKTASKIFTFILFLFFSKIIEAQDINSLTDKIYGSDQLLFNGKLYTYCPGSKAKGNQYLINSDFKSGSICIKGKTYNNLELNYDIYNQFLLIKYKSSDQRTNILEISPVRLEKFQIENLNFELITAFEDTSKIYQVIGEGTRKILYTWSKKLIPNNTSGSNDFEFTKPEIKRYVYTENKKFQFKNNRHFLAIFEPEKSLMIKKYLKSNKIKVKNASDKTMTDLITYCNNL